MFTVVSRFSMYYLGRRDGDRPPEIAVCNSPDRV